MNSKALNYILLLSGVLVAIHYFVSLFLLDVYLGRYGLTTISVISWEDIQFSFALLNNYLFLRILMYTVPFIILFETFKFRPNGLYNPQKYKKYEKVKIIIGAIGLLLTITICAIYICHNWEFNEWLVVFLFILGALSLYLIFPKADIIALIVLFIAIISIYRRVIGSEAPYSNYVKIKLDDGNIIESDSINKLIFLGTKYVVIENDSPNVKLYPTDRVKEIDWMKKK